MGESKEKGVVVSDLFINFNKPKNVMSNITFREHKMYEAHTEHQNGYVRYVKSDLVEKYETVLKRIANENLSAKDCESFAKAALR